MSSIQGIRKGSVRWTVGYTIKLGVACTPVMSRSTQNSNCSNVSIIKLLKLHWTRNQEVKALFFSLKVLSAC